MAKKVFTDESLKTLVDETKLYTDNAVSTKADKTHSHAISDVSGLQSALDGKAASSHGTHVSYSTTSPVMDGTASVGSASTVARSDHKHPTDTSRASKTEFDTHTANTTAHITSTERSNWNAAKTHADSAHAPSNAEKNQNAFSNITVGSTTVAADSPTDTVTFVGSNVTITPDATNDKVTFSVADGSTSGKGVVQLTNSTSSTSTTTAATPSAVKSAYDLANTAKTNAATAQTKADNAYTLAESKVDSLSDLGVTATAAELNYTDGVTSNIQTQLDGKAASSHNHAASNITSGTLSSDRLPTVPIAKGGTGATTAAAALTNLGLTATAAELNKMDGVTATTAELNYVDGVTSNIQTQLNAKQASITGAATTITGSNLTASRALISNSSGKVAVSAVTSTELGYLDGVTSAIQTQLDGKSNTSHTHSYAGSSSAGGAATSANKLNTNAGDSNTPVYFSSGIPVACTSLDLNTSGNAATATKLATARTIALKDGATGTATSFDGTGNISIPVTAVKEAYLSWGGRNMSASFSPLDAALIPTLGANRLAFMNANGITIEYSRDGGSTWTDYGASNSTKQGLVSGVIQSIRIGNSTATKTDKSKYMVRVTLNAKSGSVYSVLNKFVIDISTEGSSGTYCTLQTRTGANADAGTNTWATVIDKASISGWSGYNVLNTTFTFGSNADHAREIRFIFGVTSHSSSSTYAGLMIRGIMAFGGVGWTTPSNLAKHNHLYSYDASQNAIFPAGVTATTFTGALSGNADTATALTSKSIGSATNPVYFDANGKPVKTTYTLSKSVPSDAKFTDTTYSAATTSAAGLMSAADKTKLNGIATGANAYTHPTTSGNKHIPSGGSSGQILRWSADGTAVWGADNNTTYSNMTAATSSAAGKAGLVPAPAAGKQTSFLRGDGTWVVPTNTTYSNFVKSGSGAKAGLVPAPSTTAGTTKYLREDGTWAVPPDTNTTYTFNGAVSTIKDSNLTASRALISNSSGKVAVSAVTSTELGYLDGVTSAIQTQLNGKAPKYQYSTTDLTAGSSSLTTGTLYFVYE